MARTLLVISFLVTIGCDETGNLKAQETEQAKLEKEAAAYIEANQDKLMKLLDGRSSFSEVLNKCRNLATKELPKQKPIDFTSERLTGSWEEGFAIERFHALDKNGTQIPFHYKCGFDHKKNVKSFTLSVG